jgi:CelD/BcsL family acetyltransferase involved in cellulose biosynthesis
MQINYKQFSEIDSLKSDWFRLEQGQDMTYFQRYDWYAMLSKITIESESYSHTIASVKNQGKTILLAPLSIVNLKILAWHFNTAVIIGGGAWSDYMNFIYSEFNPQAVSALFQSLNRIYGVKRIHFECLPEHTQLYRWLQDYYKFKRKSCCVCVSLRLPESEDGYHKLLTKNSRQNIRTATNRAERDGLSFIYNYDDPNMDVELFCRIRAERREIQDAMHRPTWRDKARFILKHPLAKFQTRDIYPSWHYTPFTHDRSSRFMTVRDSTGNLCAAFNYALDETHKTIALMAAATNSNYYKYSPGILLLYHFVINNIASGHQLKTLDFTRGNEIYKYTLGGKEHYIWNFDIDL